MYAKHLESSDLGSKSTVVAVALCIDEANKGNKPIKAKLGNVMTMDGSIRISHRYVSDQKSGCQCRCNVSVST